MDFRAGCSSCSMTDSFVTNAVLIERAVSCWHLHQLISRTTQYVDSWLSDWTKNETVGSRQGARAPVTNSWRRYWFRVVEPSVCWSLPVMIVTFHVASDEVGCDMLCCADQWTAVGRRGVRGQNARRRAAMKASFNASAAVTTHYLNTQDDLVTAITRRPRLADRPPTVLVRRCSTCFFSESRMLSLKDRTPAVP